MNYRLVKDRPPGVRFGDCRVTLMVVWHCVSHVVASFVAAEGMYGWKELRPTVGFG